MQRADHLTRVAPRVRRGPRRRRGRVRRGPLRPRAAPRGGPHPRGGRRARCRRGSTRGCRRPRPGSRIVVRQLLTAMRHAARSREIAELAVAAPRRRRRRLRHRRRRGGLPAHPAPRRLRVPPARERPLHHPRRRGVRAAVDLGGDPVVRRRPARPRRADHRRHRSQLEDGGRRSSAGWREYVRDKRIPLELCPHSNIQTGRRRLDRRAPDRAARRAALPGHRQHRQPADERHLDDPRDGARSSRPSAGTSTTCAGSRSTR